MQTSLRFDNRKATNLEQLADGVSDPNNKVSVLQENGDSMSKESGLNGGYEVGIGLGKVISVGQDGNHKGDGVKDTLEERSLNMTNRSDNDAVRQVRVKHAEEDDKGNRVSMEEYTGR